MNGRYKDVNRESSRFVFQDISNLWNATTPSPVDITGKFTSRVFTFALQHLKPGKVYSPKSICPELLLYTEAALRSWLCGFLSSCLRRLKICNIWRRALVVAIPKPKNPVENRESYRPILFCVSYKIFDRLIHTHVEPIIDPPLSREQAGFWHRWSTVDQAVLLRQNIENSFEAKKRASAVFVDLTAAYDTVWHCGLTCKLLRLLPDKRMIRIILELIQNRSFTFTTGDSKRSRLRRLKYGVLQGSVLTPSFSICTYLRSSLDNLQNVCLCR